MTAASTTERPSDARPHATRLMVTDGRQLEDDPLAAALDRVRERCAGIVAALRSDGYHAPEAPGLMEKGIRLIHRDGMLPTLSMNLMRDPDHYRSDVPELCEAAALGMDPERLTTEPLHLRIDTLPVLIDALGTGLVTPDPRRWRVTVNMPTPWSAATIVERTSSSVRSYLPVPQERASRLRSLGALTIIGADLNGVDTWFLTPACAVLFDGRANDPMEILRSLSTERGG